MQAKNVNARKSHLACDAVMSNQVCLFKPRNAKVCNQGIRTLCVEFRIHVHGPWWFEFSHGSLNQKSKIKTKTEKQSPSKGQAHVIWTRKGILFSKSSVSLPPQASGHEPGVSNDHLETLSYKVAALASQQQRGVFYIVTCIILYHTSLYYIILLYLYC